MRSLFILVFCFGALHFCNAQIDRPNNSFAIPAEEVKNPKADNALDIKAEKDSNEIKPDETADNKVIAPKPKLVSKKPEKPFSIIETNNYKNPAELYTDNLKKQLKFKEDQERSNNGSRVNQFLGEFKTKAKKVNIIYRDHQAPDGDVIRVFVNDDIVVSHAVLTGGSNGFFLELKDGINKIDFLALNQGLSGPNTAEFRILDETGSVISSNQWNLATGVKATIILVKDDGKLTLSKQ
jgi:hypothetical protein